MQELCRETFQPRAALPGDQGWASLSTMALGALSPGLGLCPLLPKHEPHLPYGRRCAGRQGTALFLCAQRFSQTQPKIFLGWIPLSLASLIQLRKYRRFYKCGLRAECTGPFPPSVRQLKTWNWGETLSPPFFWAGLSARGCDASRAPAPPECLLHLLSLWTCLFRNVV